MEYVPSFAPLSGASEGLFSSENKKTRLVRAGIAFLFSLSALLRIFFLERRIAAVASDHRSAELANAPKNHCVPDGATGPFLMALAADYQLLLLSIWRR